MHPTCPDSRILSRLSKIPSKIRQKQSYCVQKKASLSGIYDARDFLLSFSAGLNFLIYFSQYALLYVVGIRVKKKLASMTCKFVKSACGAVLTAAMVMVVPTTVSAKEIALTFADHDLTIFGEFIAVQDDAYVLMTEMGEMIVPAAMVTCEGVECLENGVADASGS